MRRTGSNVELYHFSEEPDIRRFVPRAPLARPEVEPLVWAIDDWHAPMYYFPRDCPRACFWPLSSSDPDDVARFFGLSRVRMVIAVESRWVEAIAATTLHRYTMPPATFVSNDDTAGHWVSREPVELRIMPSLVTIGEAVADSTLAFSMTRMRNAEGWRL